MSKCAGCFHEEENHQQMDGTPNCICSGSITCRCEHFDVPYLVEFAQRIEEEKYIRKNIFDRCLYILDKLPPTRNAGEKTFAKIYNEIWYGFKIRKANTTINTEVWKRLPNQDTINREKRRVKQKFPQFATYSKEVLMEQTAIFQALVEMSAEA